VLNHQLTFAYLDSVVYLALFKFCLSKEMILFAYPHCQMPHAGGLGTDQRERVYCARQCLCGSMCHFRQLKSMWEPPSFKCKFGKQSSGVVYALKLGSQKGRNLEKTTLYDFSLFVGEDLKILNAQRP